MTNSEDEQLDEFIGEMWRVMTRIIKKEKPPGSRLADEHDLTQHQVMVLWQLRDNGPMTMGDLSEWLSVTHGVATRMVDRLLKKGMVERGHDDTDRRVVLISLTRMGHEVTEEVIAEGLAAVRGVFKNIPRREREEYLELLGRLERARSGELDE